MPRRNRNAKHAGRIQRRRWPCAHGLRKGKKLSVHDVDPRQLRLGIKEELEHTTSRRQACGISMDHLAENKRYYTVLARAGLAGLGRRRRRS